MNLIINENLSGKDKGRLCKQLNKEWDLGELGVMSVRNIIRKGIAVSRNICDAPFNRRHYNSLDHEAQIKYEQRLAVKKVYTLELKDGCSVSIPKIIYDNVFEITE